MAVPGLLNEIQLLAWTHCCESPLIHAIATIGSDADGSDMQVEMIPRNFWDEDPRFLETFFDGFREQLTQRLSEASYCSSKEYLYLLTTIYADGEVGLAIFPIRSFDDSLICGADIVEALTTATKAEDLAAAFAWFEKAYPSGGGQQ